MNVDKALEELGSWGKFQKIVYFLVCLDVIFLGMSFMTYVFVAGAVPHRCFIPECDVEEKPLYLEDWLQNAVPFHKEGVNPSHCARFPSDNSAAVNASCSSPGLFLHNVTVPCSQWVYDNSEVTLASEFGLVCSDEWKRTMVGSVRSIGMFIGLPLNGIASDTYGRKTLLVTGLCLSSVMGVARSYAWNYLSFLSFEFLDAVFGTGVFPTSFILGMELMSPQKRVVGGASVFMFFSTGEALLGAIAMWSRDWRFLLRIIYFPAFMFLCYYRVIPESVRWLASQGREDEAIQILRKAAKRNGVVLSDSVLGKTEMNALVTEEKGSKDLKDTKKVSLLSAFSQLMKSRVLILRFINCCFCWLANVFVFYGITLNSVVMEGNKYTNFILTVLIEIPGTAVSIYSMKLAGRRMTQAGSLGLSGACLLAFCVVPSDMQKVRLALYMLGKMLVSLSFTSLYVYTAEMFPTPVRLSVNGFCSMFGRIGNVVVPHTPLLAQYMESLPLLLLGSIAVSSGGMALLFPETLGVQLPDTIEEAEHIGTASKNVASTAEKPAQPADPAV